MTNDSHSSSKQGVDGEPNAPRAILHKQILDVAEERPDASMETIAESVTGATASVVERVLEEYGDPAADDEPDGDASVVESSGDAPTGGSDGDAPTGESGGDTPVAEPSTETDDDQPADGSAGGTDETPATERQPTTDGGTKSNSSEDASEPSADSQSSTPDPDPSELTEKQYETLRAIYRRPEATQADLADELGVSGPTINQRVNGIDGFDWSDRYAIAEQVVGDDHDASDTGSDDVDDATGHTGADSNSSGQSSGPSESGGSSHSDRGGDESVASDRGDDEPTGSGREDDERRADGRSEADRQRAGSEASSGSESESESRSESGSGTEARADADGDRTDASTAASDRQLDAVHDRLETLSRQVASLEAELESARGDTGQRTASVLTDPELAHKIVHACLRSDRITEDEELRLLREIVATGAAPQSVAEVGGSVTSVADGTSEYSSVEQD